jgi:hypothetical protein
MDIARIAREYGVETLPSVYLELLQNVVDTVRREALEKAARGCEARAEGAGSDDWSRGFVYACNKNASALRALAGPTSHEQQPAEVRRQLSPKP